MEQYFEINFLSYKVINEWQLKVDDISSELETSQNEMRNYNSETFRLRACWEEATEQLDVMKRENKNLAEEIKDLLEQVVLINLFHFNSGFFKLLNLNEF